MRILPLMFILILTGCYSIPEIEGFDPEVWNQTEVSCDTDKVKMAEQVVKHGEVLLGDGEAIIKGLLGSPAEHELYQRNQKFFYYNLTLPDCEHPKRLSIRFDALDRVKEVTIIEWM